MVWVSNQYTLENFRLISSAITAGFAFYYTTQAVRGPMTKINQSKCSIAGPIFSKYWTGHCPERSRTCVPEDEIFRKFRRKTAEWMADFEKPYFSLELEIFKSTTNDDEPAPAVETPSTSEITFSA